ncbi:hypothetical protein ACJRO7_008895 [Eucalyptus globulus]|uniref:Uncharacterized protein n=1 Tax=Eucalyptus globulus TaxID=34317 RepID=A0ABD3IUK3_EUCGL
MKKFLASKVAVGVVMLLFLAETIVKPKEAFRVLIKGNEGGCANDAARVLILQALQKGPVPPSRDSGGHTPGADTTNTRAFAGQAVASPRGYFNRIAKSSMAANRK